MKQYRIDPQLEAVCLPLAKEEYDTLEKQIIRDGCLDPVKVWDREGEMVLLDGHNRLKICKDNKLPVPESTTIEIESIDEAVIWICDNQKGRRNVATKEQQDYLSGKRYEAQKNINKFKGNQYIEQGSAEKLLYQAKYNCPTAERQGADEGISHTTVKENAKFAKGIDAIRKVSPELADKVLTQNKVGETAPNLTKSEVMAVTRLPFEKQTEVVISGPDAIRKATKEAEEQRKFNEFNKTVAEKTAMANANIDRVFGSNGDACLMPNMAQKWCDDCEWGFDIYLPAPNEPCCPYCKGSNLSKRDEDWNPREVV